MMPIKPVLVLLALVTAMLLGVSYSRHLRQQKVADCTYRVLQSRIERSIGEWAKSEKVLAADPDCARTDSGRMEHANWLLDQGRVVPAEAAFAEETRRQPGTAEAWARWGQSLALLGKRDQAIQALQHSLLLNPGDSVATSRLHDLTHPGDPGSAGRGHGGGRRLPFRRGRQMSR